MTDIAAQRQFFYQQLRAAAAAEASAPSVQPHISDAQMVEELVRVTKPPEPKDVRTFHIAADIAVLIAIWFLVLWREKTEPCEERFAKLRELLSGG